MSEETDETDETSEYRKQVVLGDPAEHCEVVLVADDPEWPQRFQEEAAKIRSALPGVVLGLGYVGGAPPGSMSPASTIRRTCSPTSPRD